jgi:hypothetical protein
MWQADIFPDGQTFRITSFYRSDCFPYSAKISADKFPVVVQTGTVLILSVKKIG